MSGHGHLNAHGGGHIVPKDISILLPPEIETTCVFSLAQRDFFILLLLHTNCVANCFVFCFSPATLILCAKASWAGKNNNCEQLCFTASVAVAHPWAKSWRSASGACHLKAGSAGAVADSIQKPRTPAIILGRGSHNIGIGIIGITRAEEPSKANQLCRQQQGDLCLIWFHYRAHNCEKLCTGKIN